MATVYRGEKPGRQGTLSASKDGAIYNVDRVYYVQSDTREESELTVLATSGLPIIGISALAGFPGTICRSLRPQQNSKQPHLWEVVATFSTDPLQQTVPNSGGGGAPNPDPATWVPIYRGSLEYIQEVVYTDFTPSDVIGDGWGSTYGPYRFVNNARCPFPDPLTITRPIVVYDFWQYEASTIKDKVIGDRNDCINNDDITRGGETFPKWSLKCSVTEFERGYFYGYERVKIHYRIAYKPSLWTTKPLQMGYEYLETAGGSTVKVASPKIVALSSIGQKLPDDSMPIADKTFLPHKPISFSFLR